MPSFNSKKYAYVKYIHISLFNIFSSRILFYVFNFWKNRRLPFKELLEFYILIFLREKYISALSSALAINLNILYLG